MKFLKIAMMAVVLAVAAASVPAPAWAAGDAAKGKKVFKKCKACHKLVAGKKAIGPSLHGIFGRKAGTTSGFRYSKDMKAAGTNAARAHEAVYEAGRGWSASTRFYDITHGGTI